MAGISISQAPLSVPIVGTNVASATPGAVGSANLIAAAANTTGVTITSVFMSISLIGSGGAPSSSQMQLKINGVAVGGPAVIMGALNQSASSAAAGGLCAIVVPAGQAVGYQWDNSGGSNTQANITITYKNN